ncbi:asparagine synthase-related protein [Streptomyces netropsis]|uniref:Asparagine synthase (Glutamine-hydrolyzing) n=1 Tax=Streptomyces netropsis TaxID=55404 RepID=A0A7W7PGA7_STRNE|nr:asparagine synthase-related protein [Streptomyces netropsis]MBB4888889.1 asparagine synthase (glutamine-hydrolyzing) [Streptomyces netropsis]GGR11560.1 hypothetical protein GCM10010219_15970 [Streptomyces netropsis]
MTERLFDYPADAPDWPPPRPRVDIHTAEAAGKLIADWLRARVADSIARTPGRPVVLLSSGVDSSAVLAAAAPWDPVAVTVLTGDAPADADAGDVARHFDVAHEPVSVSFREAKDHAAAAVAMTGTADPWIIGKAVAIMAAAPRLRGRGAVLTGEGADVVTMGGDAPVHSQGAFDSGVLAEAGRYWTARRPGVDIGEVVGPDAPGRWCRVMQHLDLLALTRRIDHRVMWRDDDTRDPGTALDKVPLRIAAAGLGVPHRTAWRPKSPFQKSSGILDAMLDAARERAAEAPGSEWAVRPARESPELTAVTLWLAGHLPPDGPRDQ